MSKKKSANKATSAGRLEQIEALDTEVPPVPETLHQASLDVIAASILDAVLIYDDQGILRYANQAATDMLGNGLFGLSREQLAKCSHLSYPDGESVPENELPSLLAMRGGTVQGRFYRFTDRNGNPRSALITATPLMDLDERITGVIVSWKDVTEEDKLIEEKWYRNRLLETVLKADPGCLAVVAGPDMVFQMVDPQYRSIIPHPELDPVGRKFAEVWPGNAGEEGQRRLRQVLESGIPQDGQGFEIKMPNGQKRLFVSYLRPLDWERMPAVLIVLWEITRLEQAYRQEHDLLVQKSAALVESRQQVSEILESIDDGFFAIDRDWNYIYINQRAAQVGGLNPEDLIGENLWERWPQIPGTQLEKYYRQVMEERLPVSFEYQGLFTKAWYEIRVFPSSFGISVYWIDITTRKQMENRLAYKSLLLNTIHEAVMSTGVDERIVFWNRAAEELTGWKAAEVIGKLISEVVLRVEPETPEQRQATWSPLFEGKAVNQDVWIYHKDGSQVLIATTTAPVFDLAGELVGFVSAARDITEQRQAENALQQSYTEMESRVRERTRELTELQWRLIESLESERLRVSRELHDGPVQDLYGLMYQASLLGKKIPDPELQADLMVLIERIKEANADLRTIAYDLRPVSLTQLGLEKAIREYVTRVRLDYPQLDLELYLQADQDRLPESHRLALFRVCQVGLVNIVRHSQANRAEIHFSFDKELAVLEIKDNGKGFEVPKNLLHLARQGHLGLVGAAERVEALGGTLELHSLAKEGTRLVVCLPLFRQPG